MESRFVLVCYDISDTRVRNQLIHFLFSCGLARVQLSVFSGIIPLSRLKTMTRIICLTFSGEDQKILVVPLCRTCVAQIDCVNMAITTEARSHYVV